LAPFGFFVTSTGQINKIYGRFEEIGLLYLMFVFHCLYKFGLDVLLGLDAI
jgi:hypothetical protein